MKRATRPDFAPPWSQAGQHAMSPVATHDDTARFNFLANFNKYMSGCVVAGNAEAYRARVLPKWIAEHGAPPADRREIRAAMSHDPYYRMWSSLRRSGMEMRQQAGRKLVLRQLESLRDRARTLNESHPQTLQLDPSVEVPRYQSELDNHCMPGSYFAEYIDGDIGQRRHHRHHASVYGAHDDGKHDTGRGGEVGADVGRNAAYVGCQWIAFADRLPHEAP